MEHMDKTSLGFGDIVQISPGHPEYAGCMVLVEHVVNDGVIGFISVPSIGGINARRYCAVKWDEFEYCGYAVWQPVNPSTFVESDKICELSLCK